MLGYPSVEVMRWSYRAAFVLTVGAAGFLALTVWHQVMGTPQIEVSPMVHIGELVHDREYPVEIGFRNGGNAELRLGKLLSGCDCMRVELLTPAVAPGGLGSFRVILRPASPAGAEYVEKVTIPSNDPRDPQRIVLVRGRMAGSLAAAPAVIHIGDKPVGEACTSEFIVYCTDRDALFNAPRGECDIPGCRVEGGTRTSRVDFENSPAFRYLVTYAPQSVGHQSGRIIMKSDHPRYNRLEVPIEIDIPSQLTCKPSSLLFNSADLNSSQTVQISCRHPVQLEWNGVGAPADVLSVTLSPSPDQLAWTLTVRLKAHDAPKVLQRLDLRLNVGNLKGESQLTIPVTITPGLFLSEQASNMGAVR